jgi:hypothetical protein
MHHTRWYRHGDPTFRLADRGSVTSHGYHVIRRQYVHRTVLLGKIGPGSHPCHWCGTAVTWGVDLEADHVDYDRLNNDPVNLVPSCHGCNTRRAQDRVTSEQRSAYLPRGCRHPRAKLTEEEVAEIRSSTDPQRQAADRYGVSKTTIANIRRGIVWRQVVAA